MGSPLLYSLSCPLFPYMEVAGSLICMAKFPSAARGQLTPLPTKLPAVSIYGSSGQLNFQQIIGIPMCTNCAPLLADIFLYSYEAEFIQSLLSAGKKRLASQFNFTYRYIDDVLSINNPVFEKYLGQMYPPELEIKDTTESNTSASYLDLLLSIGRDGQLHTSLYDKLDDFNFHITNFPFLSSNIQSSPAYGVFISQLIRYARACSSYECFILRAMRLSNKLLG